eukprot:SM000216S06552  [mRNA]  locus=s216:2323:4541:+ [translate_table: standard]
MKFGKHLQSQIAATFPEWRESFLSYKQLKKHLKKADGRAAVGKPLLGQHPEGHTSVHQLGSRIEVPTRCTQDLLSKFGGHSNATPSQAAESQQPRSGLGSVLHEDCGTAGVTCSRQAGEVVASQVHSSIGIAAPGGPPKDAEFVQLLDRELHKLNRFYVDREEEFIIKLQDLKERIEAVHAKHGRLSFDIQGITHEILDLRRKIVTCHGLMVLLENYSFLNYIGMVKILKKHDKHVGTPLKLPYLQNVLRQPFNSTAVLKQLVQDCYNLRLVLPVSAELQLAEVSSGSNVKQAEGGEAASCSAGKHVHEQQLPAEFLLQQAGESSCVYRNSLAALANLMQFLPSRGQSGSAASTASEEVESNLTDGQAPDGEVSTHAPRRGSSIPLAMGVVPLVDDGPRKRPRPGPD